MKKFLSMTAELLITATILYLTNENWWSIIMVLVCLCLYHFIAYQKGYYVAYQEIWDEEDDEEDDEDDNGKTYIPV